MRTYGSVRYDKANNKWRIKAEPHVVMRLKRAFAKIDAKEHGTIGVSASRENSRDLEHFILRFPLEVSDPELLARLANEHKEAETVLHRLLSGIDKPKPFELKLPPREYQVVAANVLDTVQGYLLADDVGLGKTVSAICGLTDGNKLPALVVTLTHLPLQWKAEIERFTGLSVHILKSGKPYDITKYHDGKMPDVIISNYHKLSGWADTLVGLIRYVIFDEAHELRHTNSAKYSAAKCLAGGAAYRLGLSATPIFGYGPEIFNVLEVLRPGGLGTYEEFSTEWCGGGFGRKDKIKNPAAFGMHLRESGLMLRRTRKEVQRELPPVTVVPHTVEADPSALAEMKGEAIALAKRVLTQGEDFRGQKMQAAGEFDLRMREATGIAKAPYVAEFVKLLHQSTGEKIVLFGWHRKVYDIWLKELVGLNPMLYTGSESTTQKEAARKAFVEGDCQVLIISNRSGAGLDGLQKVCRIGVVGEFDYAPGVHIQGTGRIHRDGQEDSVIMYYMISEEGSDPIISDILGIKRQQLEGINSPTDDFIEQLTVDPDYIKRLAEDFLRKQGEQIPLPGITEEEA